VSIDRENNYQRSASRVACIQNQASSDFFLMSALNIIDKRSLEFQPFKKMKKCCDNPNEINKNNLLPGPGPSSRFISPDR
jgi:hypothetical protein